MQSREEIYSHVVGLMSNMFELDIDSIDAVDLIVELKNYTGKKIPPEEFRDVRTVGDVVSAVEGLPGNG